MSKPALCCGALALGCVLISPASAQLLNHKDISASIAITIAQTTIETCKANGFSVSATVVGRNGEIIVQVRGDNTGPHTIENSFRKAYTARTFRRSTLEWRDSTDPSKENAGQRQLAEVIPLGGGYPINVGNDTIGGVGVSGNNQAGDEACAKAGVEKVADKLK